MKLTKFSVTEYTIKTDKLHNDHTLLLLSDLHESVFGEHNRKLISACREADPDLILCSGDMMTVGEDYRPEISLHLYRELASFSMVCATFGNHETKLRRRREDFRSYLREVRDTGAHMLLNRHIELDAGGDRFCVTGLELRPEKYKKMRIPSMTRKELENLVGNADSSMFQILLAHNPAFAPLYFDWKPDLTVSGHYHGGIMRFGKDRCLVSPYFIPFPSYGYGHFEKNGSHLVVTSGLGEHTIPMRINNPPEIVKIHLKVVEKLWRSR